MFLSGNVHSDKSPCPIRLARIESCPLLDEVVVAQLVEQGRKAPSTGSIPVYNPNKQIKGCVR